MKQLLFVLLLSVLNVYGQIDKNDIVMEKLDDVSKLFITNDKKAQFYSLSNEEVEKIKVEVEKEFELHKNEIEPKRRKDYLLDDYIKQYVGFIEKNGDKVIFINGLCNNIEDVESLKNQVYIVFDGGYCFFQIKIDAKTMKCLSFSFNGFA